MSNNDVTEVDDSIEVWKVKKLIKNLEAARGNGTSMISLIVPPRDQISRIAKLLSLEYGTATNIKSRVNRLSVQSAITSVQSRLKLYNRVPTNGLVLYCGTVITEDGKEKKITIDFEPFRPVNSSLYLCDNKFHTEALNSLLENDKKFGFVIMDGNGSLFGSLTGNTKEVLHKFHVDLPKKHGRGGQSQRRFERLRMEKRHNYLRKVAECCTELFITNDRPNIAGLILAGSADFKSELNKSDMFDIRLSQIVLKLVDISYGDESGFTQAIALSSDCLSNVSFNREKKIIDKLFTEINVDSGRYVYGLNDSLQAIDMNALETLIVWENLEVYMITLVNGTTDEVTYKYVSRDVMRKCERYYDPQTNVELTVTETQSFLEWLTENYSKLGLILELVGDQSPQGSQFVKGFGGIGGILRYKVDFNPTPLDNFDDDSLEDEYNNYEDDLDDFESFM